MADYIDREWLLQNTNTGMDTIQMMQTMIDAPAADVAEVVRCRECIYWEQIEDSKYGFCGRAMDIRPHETVYCAFGERKDGADNG